MPSVAVLLARGFEEIETMTIVDILRRAEIHTALAGLSEGPITGSRNVKVIPEALIDSVNPDDFDMLVLPGGQPGSDNLNGDKRVKKLLQDFDRKEKLIGAICAAPYVLNNAGLLKGKKATCYPSCKDLLKDANYSEDKVVIDRNIITSRGPATAVCFALAIVDQLLGKKKALEIKNAILLPEGYCDI